MSSEGILPQTRFGQNFLCDESIINSIVDLCGISREDRVLEIGPGLGSLTYPLSELTDNLTCVEIDHGLARYLSENVKYPTIAADNGIQGRAVCSFVVNKDGSISDVEVVRSGGDPSLDKEALRVIKSMPKWKPGTIKGKPVRVKFTLPVNFSLN